jgi:hypothetical protein
MATSIERKGNSVGNQALKEGVIKERVINPKNIKEAILKIFGETINKDTDGVTERGPYVIKTKVYLGFGLYIVNTAFKDELPIATYRRWPMNWPDKTATPQQNADYDLNGVRTFEKEGISQTSQVSIFLIERNQWDKTRKSNLLIITDKESGKCGDAEKFNSDELLSIAAALKLKSRYLKG